MKSGLYVVLGSPVDGQDVISPIFFTDFSTNKTGLSRASMPGQGSNVS